jgi:general secretion pathway protein D
MLLCALAAGCAEEFGAHRRESVCPSCRAPSPVGWSTASDSTTAGPANPAAAWPPLSAPDQVVPAAWQTPANKAGAAEVVETPAGTPAPLQPQFAPPQASPPPPSNGPLLTLHVDDLDVRKTLEMLSRQARVNILVSPGVSGKVTVDLRDKPLHEILDAVGRLCDLTMRRDKDILYVCTPAEQRAAEEDNLPIRVYHLNYVRSKDVADMIKPLLSKSGAISSSPDADTGYPNNFVGAPTAGSTGGGGGGGATKAGGNSMAGGEIVIVQDYENNLKNVDRVIAQIDVQPIQVLIEAVLVSVRIDKDLDLGVNYAVLDGSGRALGLVGNGSIINATAGFTPASVLAPAAVGAANTIKSVTTETTGLLPTNTTTTSTGTTGQVNGNPVNGFAQNAHGIKYGWTGGNVTGFISALQTRGETKVLATPRILVLNKQPAEIHVGENLGYQTSTVSQTSTTQTVQFMSVGTQLRLRPFVSADGIIRMEVHPERSAGALDINGIPQTNTSEATSNIMVREGTTIVIGGLMDTEIVKKEEGIPFLMDLPLLGNIFRHTNTTTTKRELVVILTPYICRPECPEATNFLGRPNALGLDARVSERPLAERKDAPSLYEIPPPAVSHP